MADLSAEHIYPPGSLTPEIWSDSLLPLIKEASSFVENFKFPSLRLRGQTAYYHKVVELRDLRNFIIQHQLNLDKFSFSLKRTFRFVSKEYKDNFVLLCSEFPDLIKGLKSNEEKHDALAQKNVKTQLLSEWLTRKELFEDVMSRIERIIKELDRMFKELEFVLNMGKLESYGYVVQEAKSKLTNSIQT